MSHSNDDVVIVLDTSAPSGNPSDIGTEQVMDFGFLKRDIPMRFSIILAANDDVIIEVKSLLSDNYVTVFTWTGGDDAPVDLYVSQYWRVRRTIDGGVGDSVVKIENHFNKRLEEDV